MREATEFYQAIEELIEAYSKDKGLKPCPLCRVSLLVDNKLSCDYCPWVLFEKTFCFGYNSKQRRARISRLRSWLVKIDNIRRAEDA